MVYKMCTMTHKIEIKRLEAALRTAAKLVRNHGDDFLAVFEQIEAAVFEARSKQSAKARALALSFEAT